MSLRPCKKSLFRAVRSNAYDKAVTVANAVINTPQRMLRYVDKARDKAVSKLQRATQQVTDELTLGLRMMRAYAEGSYRDVSTETLVTLTAATIYFPPISF